MNVSDDTQIWTARLAVTGIGYVDCDVIQHNGKFWLVKDWLEYKQEGFSIPTRAICLETIQYSRVDADNFQFLVTGPLPKYLFEDAPLPPEAAQFVVLEKPDVRRVLPTLH